MTESEMVDEIIRENRLSQERMNKLFQRLERCESRLAIISCDLSRFQGELNAAPATLPEPDILDMYNRFQYEASSK